MCRLCRSFPASPAPLGLALAPPDRGAILSPLMKIMTEILPTQGQAQRCAGGVPAGCHPRPLRGALRGPSATPSCSREFLRHLCPFRCGHNPGRGPSFSYPSESSGDIIQVNCVSRSAPCTRSSRAGPRAQRVPWLIVPHPRPVPPGLFQMPSRLSGSPRPTQPQALLHPTQGGEGSPQHPAWSRRRGRTCLASWVGAGGTPPCPLLGWRQFPSPASESGLRAFCVLGPRAGGRAVKRTHCCPL